MKSQKLPALYLIKLSLRILLVHIKLNNIIHSVSSLHSLAVYMTDHNFSDFRLLFAQCIAFCGLGTPKSLGSCLYCHMHVFSYIKTCKICIPSNLNPCQPSKFLYSSFLVLFCCCYFLVKYSWSYCFCQKSQANQQADMFFPKLTNKSEQAALDDAAATNYRKYFASCCQHENKEF